MGLLHRRHVIIGLLAVFIAWANAQWVMPPPPSAPALACVSCHKAICDSHAITAHFRTSSLASASTIKGRFKGRVVFNDRLEVVLEKKKDGRFFQTALFNGALYESEPFDVVIGSGRKGQSYLYWDSVRLFQLPISYYTPLDSWCNSPGYPMNLVYFNKQVPGQCMECHATGAKVLEMEGGAVGFERGSVVYGIDCERCHGDGQAHVAWHTGHPGEKVGVSIVSARRLGRQQRLDACALCHSGFRRGLRPSFTFRVGDTLDKFSTPNYNTDSSGNLDVHGNQYGLLTTSRCFQGSQMDCSSCHNVHKDEWGREEVFSQRCMSCHRAPGVDAGGGQSAGCKFPPVKERGLVGNCVDCHMPALPSQKILLQFSGAAKPVHDLVRTHHIGIYPEISRAYLRARK
ncbi:MAG TPA: multiheme c-type cytochrome [Puia sp.]